MKLRLPLLAGLLALGGCETLPGPPPRAQVTGEVMWAQAAAVPAGSILELRLLADGPPGPPVLDLVRLPVEGQQRLDFALSAPLDWVTPGGAYTVSAAVMDAEGRLTWAAAAPPPGPIFPRPAHHVLVLAPR